MGCTRPLSCRLGIHSWRHDMPPWIEWCPKCGEIRNTRDAGAPLPTLAELQHWHNR